MKFADFAVRLGYCVSGMYCFGFGCYSSGYYWVPIQAAKICSFFVHSVANLQILCNFV